MWSTGAAATAASIQPQVTMLSMMATLIPATINLDPLKTVRLRNLFPVLTLKTFIGKTDVGGSVSG